MEKIGLLIGVVNTVVIAAVLGLFVFTKVIYKRPEITEAHERKILAKNEHKTVVNNNLKKGIVDLEPITANLDPYTDADGKQKTHYVSITLAVEIRDEAEVKKFEAIKPIVLDSIIQLVGKKKFEDLNQVQGRYLFRSQIIDATNTYLKDQMVTEVYFTDFLMQ